jgi:uncharacterized protein
MKLKRIAVTLLVLIVLGLGTSWLAVSFLIAPAAQKVGPPPANLTGSRAVTFTSDPGATIHGWFVPGTKGSGAVALMHGVRSNRLSLIERARFLSQSGFTVLLFDFQAHGESVGRHITFGYLESRDAIAAVKFLKANAPGEKIGVVGISMGGAATLLADPPLQVEALVLEMVYPTIDEAVSNRITRWLGSWSGKLAHLLTWQLQPRLGFSTAALRPIDHVGSITIPKLFIAGADDRHTTLAETQRMYETAAQPKELWIVSKAAHVDLHSANKVEYEHRVVGFFQTHLR